MVCIFQPTPRSSAGASATAITAWALTAWSGCFPRVDADVQARLFNADGSEAEISGNGTRCVAAYLCSEQPRERFAIRTGAGVKTCTLTSRSESSYEFEIAMGGPEVGDEFPIKLAFAEVRGIPVSMGNPHYVVFVKEFSVGVAGRSGGDRAATSFPPGSQRRTGNY